jgi:hypothetical protein
LRFHAVSALHRLDPTGSEIAERVLELIDDPDDDIALLAADMAASMVIPEAAERLQRLRARGAETARGGLLAMGRLLAGAPEAIDGAQRAQLVADLEKVARRVPEGLEACEVLGALADDDARRVLRAVADGWFVHRLVRVGAAAALAVAGDAAGADRLGRALGSWRRDARGYAIELVGRHGLEAFADRLTAIASSRRDYHSDTAVIALAALGAAPEVLEGFATDPRPEVRLEAVRALAARDPSNALLRSLAADDPDAEVRLAAAANKG